MTSDAICRWAMVFGAIGIGFGSLSLVLCFTVLRRALRLYRAAWFGAAPPPSRYWGHREEREC